jgi:hypothetical protein
MSNLKICGEILQDQFDMLNSIADLHEIEVPVSKRSFKNLTNKEKAHFNTCLTGEIINDFVEEIERQQKQHARAINTLLTLLDQCEDEGQFKMLMKMDLFKTWRERVADSGLLGDDDDCECESCSQVKEALNGA